MSADLLDANGVLCAVCPEMVLTLAATLPSASAVVCDLRAQILHQVQIFPVQPWLPGVASLEHRSTILGAMPSGVMYTGNGIIDG